MKKRLSEHHLRLAASIRETWRVDPHLTHPESTLNKNTRKKTMDIKSGRKNDL